MRAIDRPERVMTSISNVLHADKQLRSMICSETSRRPTVRAVLTLGLVLLFFLSMARQAAGPLREQTFVNQIDAIFSGAVQPGQPGAAVLVKKGGTILFAEGYGV